MSAGQRGFTGIEPLFSDAVMAAGGVDWMSSLGQQHEVMDIYFKPFVSCRWNQPAIAGALEIARQHQLKPGEIAQIRVHTFEAAVRLSCAPPRNTEEAQYNLAYPVAAALIDGELGPRQTLPPRLFDETVLSLAGRVEAGVKPEYEQAFPAKVLADVEVTGRDAQVFAVTKKQAVWEPPDTLPTDNELETKFRWLVNPVLGQQQTSAIIELIWRFEQVADAQNLLALGVIGPS